MDEFARDTALTYADLEPLIEAEVNDPLPAGLMQTEWLEEPVLDPQWLEEPSLDATWLELPDLDPDWLPSLEQEESALTFERDYDLDLEH